MQRIPRGDGEFIWKISNATTVAQIPALDAEFGEYAQELELYAFIKTKIFVEYLEYREDINLKINDIVESVGVKLVLPARTSYIKELPDPVIPNKG